MSTFDHFLDKSGPVALVIRERLRPVAGRGSVVFPPTYAGVDGYLIDPVGVGDDQTNRCVLDSVQSQANRIEPEFMEPPYAALVPQVSVKAGEVTFNVMEMAHRLADASARFSSLGDTIDAAFAELANTRNAMPLARLNPLALVLGVWDSRGTGVKVQRSLGSTVFAENVSPLRRNAVFVSSFNAENVDELESMKKELDKKASTVGLAHAPSDGHGGVIVHGEIMRETVLNLIGIRQCKGTNQEETELLRPYLLGLALVAMTMPQDYSFRAGCQLVRDGADAVTSTVVKRSGDETALDVDHDAAIEYATAAADAFGVSAEPMIGDFDVAKAKQYAKKA